MAVAASRSWPGAALAGAAAMAMGAILALSLGGLAVMVSISALGVTGSESGCDATICEVSGVEIIGGGASMIGGAVLLICGVPRVTDETAGAANGGWLPTSQAAPITPLAGRMHSREPMISLTVG